MGGSGQSAQILSEKTGIKQAPDLDALLADASTVVVAFKPQHLATADPRLTMLTAGKLIISVLAGQHLARLAQVFPNARISCGPCPTLRVKSARESQDGVHSKNYLQQIMPKSKRCWVHLGSNSRFRKTKWTLSRRSVGAAQPIFLNLLLHCAKEGSPPASPRTRPSADRRNTTRIQQIARTSPNRAGDIAKSGNFAQRRDIFRPKKDGIPRLQKSRFRSHYGRKSPVGGAFEKLLKSGHTNADFPQRTNSVFSYIICKKLFQHEHS